MKLITRYIGGCILCFLVLAKMFLNYFGNYDMIYGNSFQTKQRSRSRNMISAVEFQTIPNIQTGNLLIDEYGQNDPNTDGENGRGISISEEEERNISAVLNKYKINILASDRIPLNRMVPDSRPPGCKQRKYPHDLPKASIVIPFYDEWPSVLMRTVYSIINRTPRHLLEEIILVDDNSQIVELKTQLDDYIGKKYPKRLVRLIHNPIREGLIKARLTGYKASVGEVIVFFDSHMEVNIDWLQPLLAAVKKDPTTIAMGMLDYINSKSLEYRVSPGLTRYGFDWRLIFFETYFRPDQIGPAKEDPRPGVVMVGPAFAVNSKYFGAIGAYDDGMKIWGGENLEFPWRVWMCGGHLLHFPCSRVGHIARIQPYTFPGGRRSIEVYNYKRAVEVWMEPHHKRIIYDHFPEMEAMSVGDLSQRFELKEKLKCKNFTWYIKNVWPELAVLNEDTRAWGSVQNVRTHMCLDNQGYLFQMAARLIADICTHRLATQGFSWTQDKLLKSSLQCVVVKEMNAAPLPMLKDCIIGPPDQWEHKKNSYLKHVKSGLCLELGNRGLVMRKCAPLLIRQQWIFLHYEM